MESTSRNFSRLNPTYWLVAVTLFTQNHCLRTWTRQKYRYLSLRKCRAMLARPISVQTSTANEQEIFTSSSAARSFLPRCHSTMSSDIVPSPVRIWIQHSRAEIVQVEGRNHARLPGRADLFPLYDCAWKVTVFSVDGQWHRLVTPGEDSPQRQEWKKSHPAQETAALDLKRAELVAWEAQLKAREGILVQKEKAMEAEMAKLKSENEAEQSTSKSQAGQSPRSGSPRISESSSFRTVNSGDASVATPASPGKSPRLSFFGARPSLGASSNASSSESSSSSAFGLASQHRALNRSGSAHLDTSTSSSSSRPVSALPLSVALPLDNVSSSLPNSSPLMPLGSPSSPGSGRLERFSSQHSLGSPRRVASLPLGSPEVKQYTPFGDLSRDSSDSQIDVVSPGGTRHFVTSVPSSPLRSRGASQKGMIDYELPEERMWTQEQCDEWLKQKLYPSTDPNEKTSSGQRAIHCSSLDGQVEVVEFLISRGGVDVNQKDLIGNTPLICAASKGRMETVRWLLAHGALLEAVAPSGRTALHSAAAGGYLDVCQLLLSLGSDPLRKEQFGKSPRALAEAYQHSQVSSLLKNAEAEKYAGR